MREAEAQEVLLVRAFEASDPEGRVLPFEERRRATEEARLEAASGSAAALAPRARRLREVLEGRVPGLAGLLRSTRFGAGFGPFVTFGALSLGLASNALGPEHRISVLQWPLIGLVLWNLLVYALFLGHAALHGRAAARNAAAPEPGSESAARGAGLASRLLDWTLTRFVHRARRRSAEDALVVSTALARYAGAWRRAVMPLLASRARLTLHLGSLSLALGVVAGMYLRGLAFHYEATWESTFLDEHGMRGLVGTVLGPASGLLGRPIPSAVDLWAIQAPRSGPAATWIHLYAFTALLFVVGPRLVLALLEVRTATRLAADLPVDVGAGYEARSGGRAAMPGARVEVVPYSHRPTARAADALKSRLFDVFGTGAEIAVAEPLAYGAEADGLPATAAGRPRAVLVLVALAQTPETEVHGRFLAEVRAGLAAGDRLVVVADGSTYRERIADEARLSERRRAWDRVAREAGAPVVHVDLDREEGDGPADRLREALSGDAGGRAP